MPERNAEPNHAGLVLFYSLAFGISWMGWIPVLLAPRGLNLSLVVVAVGPALAAWIAARRAQPGSETALLHALLRWRVPLRWYVFAVLMPAGLLAIGWQLRRFAPSLTHADLAASVLTPAFVLQCVLANPLEEIGWRGFALPRLEARFGTVSASLIVGAGWALWHLPIFFWTESPMSQLPPLSWTALLVAESFILTWLYHRARSSLLVVSLFHIAVNIAGVLIGVPSYTAAATIFGGAALLLFWTMPLRSRSDSC